MEPALTTFVAEGLGVTLAREHIKKLPHPGVTFRLLTPPIKSDYYIAWNRDNDSRALQQYIEIVKRLAKAARLKGVGRASGSDHNLAMLGSEGLSIRFHSMTLEHT